MRCTTQSSSTDPLTNTHGLARNKFDDASIARLDRLRGFFKSLTSSTIDLLNKLREFTSDVSSMTIKHRGIAGTNLTRVIEDNNLGIERSSLLSGVVLGVRCNVTTTDILDRHVPENEWLVSTEKTRQKNPLHVETDIVTWVTLLELFVVHFNGLDFSGHVRGCESNDHASLDNASLDTTNRHCADTTDFVNILERETKRFFRWTCWGINSINGIK